jgi:hemoglobin
LKKDIASRKDIEVIVNEFYAKVRKDKLLGPIFNDIFKLNWEKHLETMYNFWDNILFYTGSYQGNPMNLHTHISEMTAIKKSHFKRWDKLFEETVDEFYEGEKASLIKKRAANIAKIMQDNIFSRTRQQ